jgi:hypothetical protein
MEKMIVFRGAEGAAVHEYRELNLVPKGWIRQTRSACSG